MKMGVSKQPLVTVEEYTQLTPTLWSSQIPRPPFYQARVTHNSRLSSGIGKASFRPPVAHSTGMELQAHRRQHTNLHNWPACEEKAGTEGLTPSVAEVLSQWVQDPLQIETGEQAPWSSGIWGKGVVNKNSEKFYKWSQRGRALSVPSVATYWPLAQWGMPVKEANQ